MTDPRSAVLREVAEDQTLLWEVARQAIENTLIEFRDSRISMIRGNGLVIREADGEPSSIIRFGPETGVRIALLALADHFDKQAAATP